MTTQRRLLSVMALCALALAAPAQAVDIAFRSFSGAAAIGPPAVAYAEKLKGLSTITLGEGGAVRFTKLPGTPAIPAQFGGDIMKAVAAGAAGGGFDAAYQSGGEMNVTWGFVYNSGVPFGTTFDEFMGFLYGKSVEGGMTGLELLQATLDAANANVVAVPIVGSTEQGSGYFPAPVGDVRGRRGIGLAGLCQSGWTFRYLPPAQNVLQQACADLVARRWIPSTNIKFIAAVPGGGSLTAAVKAGTIQAFEFATPVDDVSQLIGADNPGTVGVRYMHFPGWHQQFLITYMLINKQVWNGLSPAQQALVQSVGRDHVVSSYGENLRQQGAALRTILDLNKTDADPANDMVVVQWPERDLGHLRDATIEFLTARADDATLPLADRQAYVTILDQFRKFVRANDLYWDVRAVDPQTRFKGWYDWNGEPWGEPEPHGGCRRHD